MRFNSAQHEQYDPITSSLLSLADLAIAAAGFLMLRTDRVSPLLAVV